MKTYSELIQRDVLDEAETVWRVRHNDAALGHLDEHFTTAHTVRPGTKRAQYTVWRIFPKASDTEWDAWATARGIDPEVGYIHHAGVRTTVPFASTHWVMNMASQQWRAFRLWKTYLEVLNYNSGAASAPFELLQMDMVLWYPWLDDTTVLTADEFIGAPATEAHPYMVGCRLAFIELQQNMDLRYGVGRVWVYGNFGAAVYLDGTDANTKAILAASKLAFAQVTFSMNAGDTSLDISNINATLTTLDTHLRAGRSLHCGFTDYAAPSDKRHRLAAALFALAGPNWDDHDRLFARYASAPDSSMNRIETWEKPELLHMLNYLGRPLGPRYSEQSGRLLRRKFERGEVVVWAKAVKTNPSDGYAWTPGAGWLLQSNGTLVAASPQTLMANAGEVLLYAKPEEAVLPYTSTPAASVASSTPPTAPGLLYTLVEWPVDFADFYTIETPAHFTVHQGGAPPAVSRVLGCVYVANYSGDEDLLLGRTGATVSLVAGGRVLYVVNVTLAENPGDGVLFPRTDLSGDEVAALQVEFDYRLEQGSDELPVPDPF